MKRSELKKKFNRTGIVILPVIHVLDYEQTRRNIDIVIDEGAPGLFLINHDFPLTELIPIIKKVRRNYSDLWFGVNFLAVDGDIAFPILAELQTKFDCKVDAYWADNAQIDEHSGLNQQTQAKKIQDQKNQCGWTGMYLGGVAFKKQRPVAFEDYPKAASIAGQFMDVVVTSGQATGSAAPIEKVKTFRTADQEQAMALASGVSTENLKDYRSYIDAVLVATSINYPGDFYNINPKRLRALMTEASIDI